MARTVKNTKIGTIFGRKARELAGHSEPQAGPYTVESAIGHYLEGETRQPIGIERIVGRSKRVVMLAAIVTAKAGDPRPTFGALPVADCASRRNDRPVGLAPPRQFGAGGTAVDFGVFTVLGMGKIPYGKYTEMMAPAFHRGYLKETI